MRKITSAALIALLLLTGCADKETTISNSSESIFTIEGKSYTRGDLYEVVKNAGGADLTISLAKNTLNKEIKVTEDMRKAAEEALAALIKSSGEAEFNKSIKNSGYDSKEQYLEEVLIPKQQEKVSLKEFSTKNYETLANTFALKKVRIIEVKTEELGKSAIEAIKNGSSFTDVAKEYNQSSTYTGAELITTTETSSTNNVLPKAVETQVAAMKTPALIETVITESNKFYVVQVIAISPALFTEEGIELLTTLTSVSTKYYTEAFVNAGFKVYDKEIYDEIKNNETYKSFLEQ